VRSLWSDAEARRLRERYAPEGISEDLALRVYTTRLLGADPQLVLHGGGNTSVKSRLADPLGEEVDVLYVKGSGWDMGTIEPPGLPAVRLDPLLRLVTFDELSDEEMVRIQRSNLLDPSAPNPSVETLLHAWVPHKYVDHTHANAVLALVDQPNGEAVARELYGDRVAFVPYVMPGFGLARAAREAADAHPGAEGLVLLKHGIFSFGVDAREAYERMIELVSMAEERIRSAPRRSLPAAEIAKALARPVEVAPILRGLLAVPGEGDGSYRRLVLDFRSGPEILAYVNGAELDRYSQAGTATPDHVIRTKAKPLLVPPPEAGELEVFGAAARDATERFRREYEDYFERNNARVGGTKTALDSSPRVVLVPGLGLFAAGKNAESAAVVADLAETAIAVISDAERMDRFESIAEADLFDMEYWSLEQAKLGAALDPPLTGRVVAITGGAGAIGAATASAFRTEGAEVGLLDLPGDRLEDVASDLGAAAVPCDVTDDASVSAAVDAVVETFGGLDVLISNAGAAWQGRIGEVADRTLRDSFELNFFGHQRVARAAVAVMLAQGTGGVLLFNASKQAVNPGPRFGPYGLPKAATLALMRQYAIDYGEEGIRANAVNADRIRSGLLTDEMVSARAEARGVSEADYMRGNLLRREVTAEDVAAAFLALARARKTTGAVLTVDGGNIAAALR
jgi:rhamnose utilization protein RhaD (predicted bifunctional aldolase and dehydrogenase)/NAD(P)-dependent dehydrogenase (short-subunit alcohol dehydrogenase family)